MWMSFPDVVDLQLFLTLTLMLSVSLLLVKIRILRRDMQQGTPSAFRSPTPLPNFLRPSRVSSKNTKMTWGTRPLTVVILPDGKTKVSSCGMQYLRSRLEHLYPMIGGNMHRLQGKYFADWPSGELCSVSWVKLPDGLWVRYLRKTTTSSSPRTRRQEEASIQRHLSLAQGYSPPSMTD